MAYRIDFKELSETFKFSTDESKKSLLTHSAGKKIKLLPYTTSEIIIDNFHGVVGGFSRVTTGKKSVDYDSEQLIGEATANVETGKTGEIAAIIRELLFHEDGELVNAHPYFFNYIKSEKNEMKIGQFLSDIFISEDVKEKIVELNKNEPQNVLLNLMYKSLPKMEELSKSNKSTYTLYLAEIQKQFEEDIVFLLQNNDLFLEHFEQLLRYYFFYYVSQFILHLDNFEDGKENIAVYYNLDWESRGKSRNSYKQGWKVIAPKLPKLFAHINCLEMLNHMQGCEGLIRYTDFKQIVADSTEEEKQLLADDLEQLISEYKEKVKDVVWSQHHPPYPKSEEDIFNLIKELFYAINYQFANSTRSRANEKYYKGFESFAKKFFLKKSGPLGYTLNLKQDFLIFLTKLCIKNAEKIALNDLFTKFNSRGIYFDRDSKKAIVELYEKLNLLEKKSDSGDAQYVKYIL
ncbi:DNA phosphorothioation-dependent restriction protein DptG [Halalkalibacter urbisdiaboli]|uniref:DNA phosphorothioation-dependent restriction protein DptG n=1 Tax=Halalkalibacter urbisdiaboli TaxID=1960589 RepID=UPI000B44588A|nr:DNA phosphorothioation-dependent restriction protein DptG [Halalkalibacter urbisdiaboli]